MFGLDKASRELDRDFLPVFIKVLVALAVLGFSIFAFTRPSLKPAEERVLDDSLAYGCYQAIGQDSIVLNAQGLSVPAQEFGPLEILVLPVKNHRVDLYLRRPLKIVATDGKLTYGIAHERGLRWFDLHSRAGGAFMPSFNQEPLAGFSILGPEGFVKFRRSPISEC